MKDRIKRKGLTLQIYEESIESPREYYKDMNIGKMVCFHKKYQVGDDHDFESPADFDMWVENNQNKICCILPLYMLDHSGLAFSTTPFNDRFDSGKVGYIYCTREDVEKCGYDPEDPEELQELLEQEVEEYSNWEQNIPPYYGFEITDEDDEEIESMGVFACNSYEEMIDEMKERSENKYDFLFDALLKKQMEQCL